MTKILITGNSSGLGKILFEKFNSSKKYEKVFGICKEDLDFSNSKLIENYIENFIKENDLFKEEGFTIVNCAGLNEINYIQDLSPETFDELISVNAKSNFLLAKYFFSQIKNGTILSIVSNASRIPMTSSLAYNASKAAQEMIVKQMARELWQTRGATVFGISPNKLHSTYMTSYINKRVCETRNWSEEQARDYQLKSLPIGEETDPKVLADFIFYLLSEKINHKYLHGCILPYGGPTGM
jgi:NAD(P)-dependent dehydrogenase (short-subunit alcohol dehydrogenase family)